MAALKNRFQIIKLDNKKIYDICCGSQELKVKWMREIERLINVYLEIEKKNEAQRHSAMRPESFSDTSKDMKARCMTRLATAGLTPDRDAPPSPHRPLDSSFSPGETEAGEVIEVSREMFMDLIESHQLLASHVTRLEEKLAAGYEARAKLELRLSQIEQRHEQKKARKKSSSSSGQGKEKEKEKKRKRTASKKSVAKESVIKELEQ